MKRPKAVVWASVGLWCVGSFLAALANGATNSSPDAALARKVDHYAVKASLGAAVKDLASEAGVTVQVDWKTLGKAGVTSDTKVAVDVEKVTWRQALDVMLARASQGGQALAWRVEDKGILISTQRAIMAKEEDASRSVARLTEKPEAARAQSPQRTITRHVLPTVNFDNLPFRDTLQFFQTITGANFHINWRAMEAAGIRADTPITLNVKGVSIARTMDLVFSEVNADRSRLDSVYWVVDRGVVLISTGNDLNRELVTRVIDAGSVLLVQPDAVGPRIDMQEAAQASDASNSSSGTNQSIFIPERERQSKDEESYAEQKKKQAETVVTTIKTIIGAEMWEPDGKGSIRVINNKLVITQTLLGFKMLEKALR